MKLINFSSYQYRVLHLILFLFLIYGANAQNNSEQSINTVPTKAYDTWERIHRNVSFVNNGNWLQYQVVTNENNKTVYLTNTKTKAVQKFINADKPVFSADNQWMAFAKVLPGKKLKSLKKKNPKYKQPHKMWLLNLKTKDSTEFKDVVNYKFSGSGGFIAMKRENEKVHTLLVRNLNSKQTMTFGNVKEYTWQDNGTLLAMVINTPDSIGNAIHLYNAVNGTLKILDQKNEGYSNLKWREKSDDLVVLRSFKDSLYKNNSYDLLFWKGLNSKLKSFVFNQKEYANFKANTKIEKNGISLSDDGTMVYFKTNFWENKPGTKSKEEKDSTEDESPEVEIWNSSDVDIIPSQKLNKSYGLKTAAWNVLKNTYHQLENDLIDRVHLQLDTQVSIGRDQTPYDFETMFGRPNYDLYTINTNTGEQNKVVTKSNRFWSVNAENQFFVYLKDDHLHLFDIINNSSSIITKGLNDDFIDVENDHPMPQKPAFGFAGWTVGQKSFLIYSKYDVWQFFTDGSEPNKITNGREDKIIYRVHRFDYDEKYIDIDSSVYFSMFGSLSKNSGLAVKPAGNKLKTLIFEDASVSRFIKAKNSKEVVYLKQSYEDSPDLFLTNTALKSPKQISSTNKFQDEYAWGKATLITYKNALGKDAQGILYYPANYKKGTKYPMITYIYEKLSNRYNSYIGPSKTSYYNTTVWTQNGYFVLNPDIEFIAGDPGVSSTKTLEQAVKKVIEIGDVDEDKVGLIGHSWGGYQAGFVPTQTDIFAASVAGAGLTELISMNLAVTPAFGGTPENAHFEVSQERMEVAPWKAPDSYLRNSSVMNVEKLNTPILFEVGDNDQNVNWFQGIAYYNAARRAAKPFVLLVYAKEGHGLRNEKNQKDYQQRILTWFGHYLKGENAADWVTGGIPYAEQERALKKK